MDKHVTIVAILNIAFGLMGLLAAGIVFVAIVGGGILSGDMEAITITGIVGTAIASFIFIVSIPELIAGIGLLRRKRWAKILALIIAAINLIEVPIGTALGVYALWVLLHDDTEKLFRDTSAA